MKLVIDPGHGGRDSGATYRGLFEKNVVLDIALRLEEMLRPSGIITMLSRRADLYVNLRQRVGFAEAMEADYFLSIHTNADPDEDEPGMPEAEGMEIWVNPRGRGRQMAVAMASGLAKQFPEEPWRGIKERGLYVLRKTSMPACLVELGFIDHSETNRELRQPEVREQIAFALLRGVLALGG